MLIYNELKNKPREFLAATGLKLDEFEKLLPAFQTAYQNKYPPDLTQAGKTRQRQIGGGATGALPQIDDKLFLALIMASATPFYFCTTQKHITAKIAIISMVYGIFTPASL